jgi:hypothetical protein
LEIGANSKTGITLNSIERKILRLLLERAVEKIKHHQNHDIDIREAGLRPVESNILWRNLISWGQDKDRNKPIYIHNELSLLRYFAKKLGYFKVRGISKPRVIKVKRRKEKLKMRKKKRPIINLEAYPVGKITDKEIAIQAGCSPAIVFLYRRKHNIPSQGHRGRPSLNLENYPVGKITDKEAAALVGCSAALIGRYRKKYGIPRCETAYEKMLPQESLKKKKQIASLRNKGLTLQKIGDDFGITRERVRQILLTIPKKKGLYES